jgi:hypothetical protein
MQKTTLLIIVNASVKTRAFAFINEPEEEEGGKPSAPGDTGSS